MMTSDQIRKKFLDFFQAKQHLVVPSAPIVTKNDPTLMFINSGMAQFKDFFLGVKKPTAPRIADTQKCLRVTGKHNDLEDVGYDTYHHTFFEMLGNWSFGDYFKKEAIHWAWELLTEVYQLPKERLYVTVFGGDKGDQIDTDTEAEAIWAEIVPKDQILYGSKADNFWEMGEIGPCGPCSEIHMDLRSEADRAQQPGDKLVNQDHPQVVEIWNLVFMQYERKANGGLSPLPAKHIDTGMGFERLCMAIQGKHSNYDTDLFQPLIQQVAQQAQVTYGQDPKKDIALRVIADHIRAITFTIADGQLPAPNEAGYVVRRILRRAVRYGYTYLGFEKPFLHQLVASLAKQFAAIFPEVQMQETFISNVIHEEEKSFFATLEAGLKRLQHYMDTHTEKVVEGKVAFELYDTYGFPSDLTGLIAQENGFRIDEAAFEQEMQAQKERSRKATALATDDWIIVNEADQFTFVGYDMLHTTTSVARYRQVKEKKKVFYQVVLQATPFYAESGGQVGDQGHLRYTMEGESYQVAVFDTKKENDLIVHYIAKEGFDRFITPLLKASDTPIEAQVDGLRRERIMNNHTATHLLQAALKTVLGDHVAQRGSLVSPEVLRFDFSHFAKMTEEELIQVEQLVNQKIRSNIPLEEQRNVPIQQATEEMGATALFGEKYGDFVRVITFEADFSRELCGGTHVPATGHIGYFKIVSESAIQAGVRRIEAITAAQATNYAHEQIRLVKEVKELLKAKDLTKSIQQLLEEKQALQKTIAQFEAAQTQQIKKVLLDQIEEINDMQVLISEVRVSKAEHLRQLAFELKNQFNRLFLVLVTTINQKPQIAVMIADKLVEEKEWHAGKLIKVLAKEIKGGGGGQPFFATAGGSDVTGLANVLQKASAFVKE